MQFSCKTPCHKSVIASAFSINVIGQENRPDLNPIENLWIVLKNKDYEKQPSSHKQLENVTITVWTL